MSSYNNYVTTTLYFVADRVEIEPHKENIHVSVEICESDLARQLLDNISEYDLMEHLDRNDKLRSAIRNHLETRKEE